jgi:hypothetical protein
MSSTGQLGPQPGTTLGALIRRPYRSLRRQAAACRTLLRNLPRTTRGVTNWLLNRSDYPRWSDEKNLERWWEARTQQMARMIPARSRVIEFGAGSCRLPRYLDADSKYFPSDLVSRGPDTIVFDLNKSPMPDLRHLQLDVAVFAGVLEYVVDVPALGRWLAGQVPVCVVSYDGLDTPDSGVDRIVELARRKGFGYMNSYEPAEFVQVFERAGYRCLKTDRWESQELYYFSLDAAPAGAEARS